jgi:hypothetical protein
MLLQFIVLLLLPLQLMWMLSLMQTRKRREQRCTDFCTICCVKLH